MSLHSLPPRTRSRIPYRRVGHQGHAAGRPDRTCQSVVSGDFIHGCFSLDTYDSALTPSSTTAQGLTSSICFRRNSAGPNLLIREMRSNWFAGSRKDGVGFVGH